MSKFRITAVRGREIIDCRGRPTVEVDVWVNHEILGQAAVPSGLSTGRHESVELRDGGKRYAGLGVLKAVQNVNEVIGPVIVGRDVTRQRSLDQFIVQELDGTADKSKLGANAILGVSLAIARAAAAATKRPLYRYVNANAHILPTPMFNLINGGKHAANELGIQEFIVMPVGAATFREALQMAVEIYFKLRDILITRFGRMAVNVGDEGGYAPPAKDTRQALDCLALAVEQAGYEDRIVYALDVAASHLYDRRIERYTFDGKELSREELVGEYKQLLKHYPIASLEDPLHEDDFEGFAVLANELDVQIVGDDLFVTDVQRLRRGIEMGAANALLWKVNQIGSLSEALDAATLALRSEYAVIVSERSGETEDDIIADLAVGLDAGQIKAGAPTRGERTSKYNRLLRIEEELGDSGEYAGANFRKPI